jgi:predicted restriction endonuclease
MGERLGVRVSRGLPLSACICEMNKLELLDFIENNLSIRNIAEETGKSFTSIRYWMKKYSLSTNHQQFGKQEQKYHFCSFCGKTDPTLFYGNKKTICGDCYNTLYVIPRGNITRHRIIEHFGSKCLLCGFDKYECALQVHHLVPTKKDPTFSSHRYWSWKRILRELENCVLVCGNCHSALHAGLISIPFD